jgi:hypothetical protein
VVYPRSRQEQLLHLQMVGVWEPSTLAGDGENPDELSDQLDEGDDYFSVRGELIYTRPETGDLVVKVRQRPRADGNRPIPFKLQLRGEIPLDHLRHFVALDLRRKNQQLELEGYEVLGPVAQRGNRGGKSRRAGSEKPRRDPSSLADQRRAGQAAPAPQQGGDPPMRNGAFTAGVAVLVVSLLAVGGPALGLSPWWITLLVALSLGFLTVDAGRFGGRGGHLLAEALPGGAERLRRIAIHEAGHALAADADGMPVRRVLVGSLACLRAGLASGGCTEFAPPASAKLPAEELRRWSRVLQAGMAAEECVYGDSQGGADDRALLGRLWGLSGFDADSAQRELRRARREVGQLLRSRRETLETEAQRLLDTAPRLGRPAPEA